MEHVAIDLGGRESQVCIRSKEGQVVLERRVATSQLGKLLQGLDCDSAQLLPATALPIQKHMAARPSRRAADDEARQETILTGRPLHTLDLDDPMA